MNRVVHGRIPLFAVAKVDAIIAAAAALLGLRSGRRWSSLMEPGHGLRETLQHVLHPRRGHDLHPANTASSPIARVLAGDTGFAASDEYQVVLYERARGRVREERLAAVREAITTSPHTWEDLRGDSVRERVEESIDNDADLENALAEVGELEPEDRPYLGKFLAETIYEKIVDAEADFWRSYYGVARRGPSSTGGDDDVGDRKGPA